MKKLIIIQAAFLLTSLLFLNTAKGQTSVGLNFGTFIPLPSNADNSAHYGVNLSGKYKLNSKLRIGANFGYYYKNYNNSQFFGTSLTSFIMPITGLLEYSFTDNDFSPYLGVDLGLYRVGVSSGSMSLAVSGFGAAPVAGFNYNLSDNFAINTHVKYHVLMVEAQTAKAVSINAGVAYKF